MSNNSAKRFLNPLELLNLYYSDGAVICNKESKLWQTINSLLSWENILHKKYQTDLCPLLFHIITKALPKIYITGQHFKSSSTMVPDSILVELKDRYRASLKRNMILMDELKKVTDELINNDIKVIAIKGAYLADNVYDNIACRPMGDIDILIRMNDMKKSETIFQSLNYKSMEEDPRILKLHRSFMKESTGEIIKIEVHHCLAKEVFMTNFDLNQIWSLRCIPIEYNLIYLSWHAIRHGISRFIWLCDLAELIKKNRDTISFSDIKRLGIVCNAEKHVAFCLFLMNTLLTPSSENNNDYFSELYLHNQLFVKLQNIILKNKRINVLSNLLGMTLMHPGDLIKYIPRYLRYRLF
jgi:hypothetical protein